MKSRSTTIIAAGIAVAILGAALVFLYAHNLQGTTTPTSSSSVGAYVATATIANGTKGEAVGSSVRGTSVPVAARPADAITALTQIAGLQTLRTISAGEVISASQFGPAGTPNIATNGLTIPAGKDAITITAPVPNAVAGFVSAGDLIDIYMTTKTGDPGARLLLSHVPVLAVVPANTPKVAVPSPLTSDVYFTLALSASDAEKIVFAQTYEGLWFGLVHPGDEVPSTGGQSLKSLFG